MKFLQYPTRGAAQADTAHAKGRARPGQILSAAPGGFWILPLEREPTDPKVAFLAHRWADGTYWAADSEQSR